MDGSAGVQNALEQYLARQFPQMGAGVEVTVIRMNVDTERAERLVPSLPARNGLPRAHTRFVFTDETGAPAGWVLAYVAHYDSVAVPVRNLERGESVEPGDLEFAWMETTRLRGEPLTATSFRTASQSEHTILSRPSRRGRPIFVDDLRAAYAVTTGRPVEMKHQARSMEIRLRCVVREPGHGGDLIRVHCSDTGRIYRALVIDESTVQWVETL